MNNKVRISSSEVNFITAGIEDNVRADGRGCLEYRDIFLQAGVVPQSNGSALVKIEDTHLVVSVKVEIGEPNPNFPNRGIIQCSVDWCGDTSADSSNMEDRKELEQYGATLAKRLERALTPPSGLYLNLIIFRNLQLIDYFFKREFKKRRNRPQFSLHSSRKAMLDHLY